MSNEGHSEEYQVAMAEERARAYDRGDEGVWEIAEPQSPMVDHLFDSLDDLRASLIVRAPRVTPRKENIEYSYVSPDGNTKITLWDNEEDTSSNRMEIMETDGEKVTAVFLEAGNVGVQQATREQLERRKTKTFPPNMLSDEELELAEKTTRDAMVRLYFNE